MVLTRFQMIKGALMVVIIW